MKYRVLAASILLSPLVGMMVAAAQQPGQVIAFLDRNADGKCDLNEYLTYQAGRMPTSTPTVMVK